MYSACYMLSFLPVDLDNFQKWEVWKEESSGLLFNCQLDKIKIINKINKITYVHHAVEKDGHFNMGILI